MSNDDGVMAFRLMAMCTDAAIDRVPARPLRLDELLRGH